MSKAYILYAGHVRTHETDNAIVLEAFTRRFRRDDFRFWRTHEGSLYEYDWDAANHTLSNPRFVGFLYDGWDEIKENLR